MNSVGLCQHALGFCPQYNPLFSKLTVREHLELFREMKSNPCNVIDELITDVGLTDHANMVGFRIIKCYF